MFNEGKIIYILLYCIVLVAALFALYVKKSQRKYVYLFITFVLVIIGGLRGSFTTDYSHYVAKYDYFKNVAISEFFTLDWEIDYTEKGFALLNLIFGRLFESHLPFFIFMMACTLIPIYTLARKSEDPGLYFVVYLSIGTYFVSFNITRQILAVSLYLLLLRYIEEEKPIKYVLGCILIATIHTSVIFMIPFYFLLKMKINFKTILIETGIVTFMVLFLDKIVRFVDRVFFNNKFLLFDDISGATKIQIIIVPCMFAGFALLTLWNARKAKNSAITHDMKSEALEEQSIHDTVIWNSTFYWIVMFIMELKMNYFSRMVYFFSPIAVYAVVQSIYISKYRKIVYPAILAFLTLYYFIFGQYYDVYYFFWTR